MALPRPFIPSNIKICDSLRKGPKNFTQLQEDTKLHRNTVGTRSKYLVRHNLVSRTRTGKSVIYALNLDYPRFLWVVDLDKTKLTKNDFRMLVQDPEFNASIRQISSQLHNSMKIPNLSRSIEGWLQELQQMLENNGIELSFKEFAKLVEPYMTTGICPLCLKKNRKIERLNQIPGVPHRVCLQCGFEQHH